MNPDKFFSILTKISVLEFISVGSPVDRYPGRVTDRTVPGGAANGMVNVKLYSKSSPPVTTRLSGGWTEIMPGMYGPEDSMEETINESRNSWRVQSGVPPASLSPTFNNPT